MLDDVQTTFKDNAASPDRELVTIGEAGVLKLLALGGLISWRPGASNLFLTIARRLVTEPENADEIIDTAIKFQLDSRRAVLRFGPTPT